MPDLDQSLSFKPSLDNYNLLKFQEPQNFQPIFHVTRALSSSPDSEHQTPGGMLLLPWCPGESTATGRQLGWFPWEKQQEQM